MPWFTKRWSYSYTSGRLTGAEDDLTSLTTGYGYDSNHRLQTVTPPGESAWTVNYGSNGQLTSVTRPNDPSGNETWTVQYDVATDSTGPYEVDPVTVSQFGQTDNPSGQGIAIFPPTEVPTSDPATDYKQATLYYLDGDGRLVDTIQPGGEWTATGYDEFGNTVWSMTPENIYDVGSWGLSPSLQDSVNTYSSDGTELLESLGPETYYGLPSGGTAEGRTDTVYTYGASMTNGGPLVTEVDAGLLQYAHTNDTDIRTTTYQYSGQSNRGLKLGEPTSVTTDPGTGSHLNIVSTTMFDADGRVIATIQPNNPSGGDAHETDSTYYRAGTGSGVTAGHSNPLGRHALPNQPRGPTDRQLTEHTGHNVPVR